MEFGNQSTKRSRRRGVVAGERPVMALKHWLAMKSEDGKGSTRKNTLEDLVDLTGYSVSVIKKIPAHKAVDLGTLVSICKAIGVNDLGPNDYGEKEPRAVAEMAPGSPPHNIREPLTEFIGRESEIKDVKLQLMSKRLVTLTGVGGIGKTELALQVARDLKGNYPEGTWLVELETVLDPEKVVGTLAAVLNVAEEPGKPLVQTLLQRLRDCTLLLVLDNCEHLAGACAALTKKLMQSCPQVRILATSRQRLDIRGEEAWHVPPLLLPPLQPLPSVEELGQYEAVRFFLEQASTASWRFELNNESAPAIARVCHQLDGIPLALRLAAAHARGPAPALQIEEIAQQLSKKPWRVLGRGDRTDHERHKTVRGCIEWSYALLPAQEQALLRRLSVFRGGWTRAAAEAVCSGAGIEEDAVLDLLRGLVDASLVEAEVKAGKTRYRLLELIGQYADERLAEAGERPAVGARHYDFFFRLANEAAPHLVGREQVAWFDRLEAEHDNLRAALVWSRSTRGEGFRDLRFCRLLSPFWCECGHTQEGFEWMTEALKPILGGGNGDAGAMVSEEATEELARALYAAATLAHYQGDPKAATYARQGLDLTKATNDKGLQGRLSWLVGALDPNRSKPENEREKRRLLLQACRLLRQADNPQDKADGCVGLARIWRFGKCPDRALKPMRKALLRYVEAGNTSRVTRTLNELGGWTWTSDPAGASALFKQALELADQLHNPREAGEVLWRFGLIALRADDLEEAVRCLDKSVKIFRQLFERLRLLQTLSAQGHVVFAGDEDESAEKLFHECLSVWRDLAYPNSAASDISWCFEGLAMIASARGDMERAANLLGVAWAQGREGPDHHDPEFPFDYAPTARQQYTKMRDRLSTHSDKALGFWLWGRKMKEANAVAFALGERP